MQTMANHRQVWGDKREVSFYWVSGKHWGRDCGGLLLPAGSGLIAVAGERGGSWSLWRQTARQTPPLCLTHPHLPPSILSPFGSISGSAGKFEFSSGVTFMFTDLCCGQWPCIYCRWDQTINNWREPLWRELNHGNVWEFCGRIKIGQVNDNQIKSGSYGG